MLYSFTLYSVIIVAVASADVNRDLQIDDSSVLVKINPFISKSKRIIQFSGDKRYKRDGPEKSALFLEFPESFFEDPKLKKLYNSLVGGGGSKKVGPERTKIVFQIDPAAFEEQNEKNKNLKRNIRDEDLAAFELKIAPAAPHVKKMPPGLSGFVPRHETTVAWCVETMPDGITDAPEVSEPKTELVAETMAICFPSKPVTPKLRICGGTTTEDVKSGRQNDPCQCQPANEDRQKEEETTPYDVYTQCKSTDAVVSHHLLTQCWTTEKCSPKTTFMPYAVDVFSTTYIPTTKPTCPPKVATCTPKVSTCQQFLKLVRRRKKDDQLRKFFVLSNSPQRCPPFCPPSCTTSSSTECPSTDSITTKPPCPSPKPCPTECSCPTTCPTTCSTTDSCPTTKSCCAKKKRTRVEDPLRNVLRLFQRRSSRRIRRNPPPFMRRRKRRMLIYKPKNGLRKVNFRPKRNARKKLTTHDH